MMLKALCLGLLCVIFVSHFYTPMPDNIEESWKIMALDAIAKTCTFTVRLTFFSVRYWDDLLTKNGCL